MVIGVYTKLYSVLRSRRGGKAKNQLKRYNAGDHVGSKALRPPTAERPRIYRVVVSRVDPACSAGLVHRLVVAHSVSFGSEKSELHGTFSYL